MGSISFSDTTITGLVAAVEKAGRAILGYYPEGVDTGQRAKEDGSPVTEADLAADSILAEALGQLTPGIPFISEETFSGHFDLPSDEPFWLVDPLDGTKEFIAHTGEFTVNIGLIVDRQPLFGIIGIPATGDIYGGRVGQGAWRIGRNGVRQAIAVRIPPQDGLTVTSSRYHGDPSALKEFLADYPVAHRYQRGSSYKFCDIACGHADLYPCLNRISEWDTAAGHALVLAAGGTVTTLDGGAFAYAKDTLRQPPFLVRGRR